MCGSKGGLDEATWSHGIDLGELSSNLWEMALLKEIWEFLRVRKKFWLLPIIVVMLLFGALMIFTQSSALAPFIYTLF